MRKSMLFVAAVLAFAGAPALAQSSIKPYVGAHVGISIFSDSDIAIPAVFTVAGRAVTETGAFKSGLAFGFDLGARFTENIRAEAEIAYKKNKVDTVGGESVSGMSLTVWSYMVNVIYDFTQLKLPVTPYVGGGIGFATGKTVFPTELDIGSKSDTEFAYQILLGLAYSFDNNLSLNAGYRYQGSADFEYTASVPNVGSGKVKATYGSHNILAGLTYSF